MRRYSIILVSLFSFFLFPDPLLFSAGIDEAKITRGEGPVEIEADQLLYDKEENIYEAHGRVEATRGDFSLKADHARLDMKTKDIMAWGNVVMREGEDLLECERVEINVDTRRGKVYQARLFLKDQNYHVTGREVEKLGENEYRVREGSLTTCDGEHPPWKFTVEELHVTVGGWGVAKGPLFYLEDIPALYLPLAYFPVRRERQTGFLFPSVSYSSEDGVEARTAFYWAMSKDMDSTLYLNWLGDRGPQGGLEYRYAFSRETLGEANVYGIDDKEYDGNRYAFFMKHQQAFPLGFYLKGDLNYVSDIAYPRDFDEDLPTQAKIDSRSLKSLRSTLFGGKNWDRFSFLATGMAFEDLTTESNDRTVQKLPQLSFYAHPQSLFGTPLYFDVSSSYTNFWREDGVSANRGDVLPTLSLPVRVFDVLKLESSAGFRETVYRGYHDPTDQLNQWQSRDTPVVGVDLSAEWFRVHQPDPRSGLSNLFKVAKWMHTLEPFVNYKYNRRVDQDELPLFDDVDRIAYVNAVTYGLGQRLLGKPLREGIDSGPFEYAKLNISQSYSLGDPYSVDEEGRNRDFSNIRGEMWLRFTPYLSAYSEADYNLYDGNFRRVNATVTLKDERNDALQVEYLNTKGENEIREVNLYGRIKVLRPLFLSGGLRYNLEEKSGVEAFFGTQFQAQCWTMGLSVNHIYESPDGTQQSEWKVQVYITLLGLGSVGHKPNAMDF